jgi:hypothetical protein
MAEYYERPMTETELKICNQELDNGHCKMDEPCCWPCNEVLILQKVKDIADRS